MGLSTVILFLSILGHDNQWYLWILFIPVSGVNEFSWKLSGTNQDWSSLQVRASRQVQPGNYPSSGLPLALLLQQKMLILFHLSTKCGSFF